MTRLDDMLERYGEACTKTRAAHILGRSLRTVCDMVQDGRLEAACGGTMVDVRSIAAYIEMPAQKDADARLAKRRKKDGVICRYSV